MNIVSLKWDYAFKELMTHEVIRRSFISDVLGIPPGQRKTVRLMNTFLWKRYQSQKQGVLDMPKGLPKDSWRDSALQLQSF